MAALKDFVTASGKPLVVPVGSDKTLTFTVRTKNKPVQPVDISTWIIRAVAQPDLFDPGIAAQGLLTLGTNPSNGDTMTVDTKVYTFKTNLIPTNDGEIKIGDTLAKTQSNVAEVFDTIGTPGVDYSFNTTSHPTVNISDFDNNVAILTAKSKGPAGNSIATVSSFTDAGNFFDAATLGSLVSGRDYYFDVAGAIIDGPNGKFSVSLTPADLAEPIKDLVVAIFNTEAGKKEIIIQAQMDVIDAVTI